MKCKVDTREDYAFKLLLGEDITLNGIKYKVTHVSPLGVELTPYDHRRKNMTILKFKNIYDAIH